MNTSNTQPVVFLDLDGVLIQDEKWSPSAIFELNELCAQSGAAILLITSLRLRYTPEQLHATMLQHGLDASIAFQGEVRDLSEWKAALQEGRWLSGWKQLKKGEEITLYLAERPEITNWVILDDQPRSCEPHHRCVAPKGVFNAADRMKAMELLGL